MRALRVLAIAAACALPVGCTLLSDFGRFSFDEEPDLSGATDGPVDPFDLGGLVALPLPDLARELPDGGGLDGGVLGPANGVHCGPAPGNSADPVFKTGVVYTIDTQVGAITSKDDPAFSMIGTVTQGTVVFCARSIQIPDTTVLTGTGPNRVAFVVSDTFLLQGTLSLRGEAGTSAPDGHGGDAGPGGAAGADQAKAALAPSGGQQGKSVGAFACGGGGGGGRLAGATGGQNSTAPGGAGGAAVGVDMSGLPTFNGGGGGGGGGAGNGGQFTDAKGGGGGGGGGALQITALGPLGRIVVLDDARLDVAGGGGGGGEDVRADRTRNGDVGGGGGGGGGGGLLWLEAATVDLAAVSTGCLTVVGGGGGAGGFDPKKDGAAVRQLACPYADAPIDPMAANGHFKGGDGLTPTAGGAASADNPAGAGGGGGGSPGTIFVRSATMPSAARMFPQASLTWQPL